MLPDVTEQLEHFVEDNKKSDRCNVYIQNERVRVNTERI